jgi:hypothetical protein
MTAVRYRTDLRDKPRERPFLSTYAVPNQCTGHDDKCINSEGAPTFAAVCILQERLSQRC